MLGHLAGFVARGGRQRELRAPADPIRLADIDAIAAALDRDDRPFEGKSLHHVRGDLSGGARDGAGIPGPGDLAQNQPTVRGIELRLHDEALVVLGDAAHDDHVHRSSERGVLPALGGNSVDTQLEALDLSLEFRARHLSEDRVLEELARDRAFGLAGDVPEIHTQGVAGKPVNADADLSRRGRREVPLDIDLPLQGDDGLPLVGDVAGR